MKSLKVVTVFLLCLTANKVAFSQAYTYSSPKDNTILIPLGTTIILKSDNTIDQSSLSPHEFIVTGSMSGVHQGVVKLSDDNRTILFVPALPFFPNEEVTAQIVQGIRTSDGESLPALTIHFKTTPLAHPLLSVTDSHTETVAATSTGNINVTPELLQKTSATDSLPSDFPKITVGTSNNPAPGNLFITNQLASNLNKSIGNYLMVLNNDGSVANDLQLSSPSNVFKMQPNGELSFCYRTGTNWILLDTSMTPVDSFWCGNGYTINIHDFILLPNGHALLFAYDPEPIDMSLIVPGGDPNAVVTGAVIQEIDAAKNVVFQWRTWDYLPFTDSYSDLTAQNIDLIHMNAIAVDNDGNILASMRLLSTIVKIDRQTGNIVWLLGGKQNQFTFINEHEANAPTYFSYQHDVYVMPNGNITLFDNGNQHTPNYSRGIEYKLDQQNKTATLVWEYRHSPDIFTSAMGSVERLPNGNTLIGWGIASGTGIPTFTEVHPDNSVALEMFLPLGQISHRSYKFPWKSQIPAASVTFEILQGNTYTFNTSADTTGIKVKFSSIDAGEYQYATVTAYKYAPVNPVFTTQAPLMTPSYFSLKGMGFSTFTGDIQVNLHSFPAVTNPGQTIMYARPINGGSFIPLPTSYDATRDELLCTTSVLGDFAFGVPQTVDSAYAPLQISPKNGEIINENSPMKLIWGTRGMVQTYHLQVSSDSLFSHMIVDNPNLQSTAFSMGPSDNSTTNYWRVNNTNAAGTSNWSTTEHYSTAAPYIKIVSPGGGEKVMIDSVYIIRWESNISDSVTIDLMNENKTVSLIGQDIASSTKAFRWKVPSTLSPDSNYSILVVSTSHEGISGLSNAPFTILSVVTGVQDNTNLAQRYELYQNYPNPFNPSTMISYTLPSRSFVSLKIFDLMGREVATLANGEMPAGNHTQQWNAANISSGIYFYRLVAHALPSGEAGPYTQTRKLLLLK